MNGMKEKMMVHAKRKAVTPHTMKKNNALKIWPLMSWPNPGIKNEMSAGMPCFCFMMRKITVSAIVGKIYL
jgi:hypothetical protein